MLRSEIIPVTESELIIEPEGWTDALVFETGMQQCGQAVNGMGIRVGNNGGGVFTIDQLRLIKKHIEQHLDATPNSRSTKDGE